MSPRTLDPNPSRDAAMKYAAWRMGMLEFICRPEQYPLYDHLRNRIDESRSDKTSDPKSVVLASRRIGKTFTSLLVSVEECLRNDRFTVRILSLQSKQIREFLVPMMDILLETCPGTFRPTYYKAESSFRFPNGSIITFHGVDSARFDSLRGTSADLIILDEAAFLDRLEHIVKSIAMPTLLSTGGHLIAISTPSLNSEHYFRDMCDEAEARGELKTMTIHEAGYDSELLEQWKTAAGGEDSTDWRREYLCEWVTDEHRVVIPEWHDAEAECVANHPKSEWYPRLHKYVSMDLGIVDKTVALFAYYDFSEALTVIEDELVWQGKDVTTEAIAHAIGEKEKELWGDGAKVYARISDNNNLLLLNDLTNNYQLSFGTVNKQSSESMINRVREQVAHRRIRISPKCTELRGCLKNALWDVRRKRWTTSPLYGHYDALAALQYLLISVDEHTNPVPHRDVLRERMGDRDVFWEEPVSRSRSASSALDKVFKRRKGFLES